MFFVTLNKSDEDYSPNHAVPGLSDFPDAVPLGNAVTNLDRVRTGQRYIDHVARGTKVVLCVRENRKDGRGESAPYVCLGPARLVRHESEKPIRIVWELERPMPMEMYQSAKVAAG